MKRILLSTILLFVQLSVFAQNPNLGTSGAQFLEIPIGARAASMGGAFVGLSDGSSSIFWNPAGLTSVRKSGAHISYMNWFDMFDINAVSVARNFDGIGILSVSLLSLTMDEVEITTEEEPNGTGRYYDAQDLALGISFARKLTDKFSVGISAKYISQRIWNESAVGICFDIGTKYLLDFNNMVIAMRMSNFGPDLKFEGEDLFITYDKSDQS